MQENQEIITGIVEVMKDMGIEFEYEDGDLDLREYLVDSLEFVNFILEIEQYFGIEVPANLLSYDNIDSILGFANILGDLRQELLA